MLTRHSFQVLNVQDSSATAADMFAANVLRQCAELAEIAQDTGGNAIELIAECFKDSQEALAIVEQLMFN